MLKTLLTVLGIALVPLLVACNFTASPTSPVAETPPAPTSNTAIVEPVSIPTQLLASPTVVEIAIQVTQTSTETRVFATPTLLPTIIPTSGPFEHTIQQGETLGYIIQLYGYADFNIIDEIVRLNNLPSADQLPGAGAIILIPRQTATPEPPTPDLLTIPAVSDLALVQPTSQIVNTSINQHIVKEGETILAIVSQYRTTLENISVLNPEVEFPGCNFENPSGGPDCNPQIQVGQAINVPAPTPTPTLSPTPSGNETATPTPTFNAPQVIFPPEGAIASGGVFRLQWISVGILRSDEMYLIQVQNMTSGVNFTEVTKQTSMLLPESLMPTTGQTNTISWSVTIASPNSDGVYRIVSGVAGVHNFQWRG